MLNENTLLNQDHSVAITHSNFLGLLDLYDIQKQIFIRNSNV